MEIVSNEICVLYYLRYTVGSSAAFMLSHLGLCIRITEIRYWNYVELGQCLAPSQTYRWWYCYFRILHILDFAYE